MYVDFLFLVAHAYVCESKEFVLRGKPKVRQLLSSPLPTTLEGCTPSGRMWQTLTIHVYAAFYFSTQICLKWIFIQTFFFYPINFDLKFI